MDKTTSTIPISAFFQAFIFVVLIPFLPLLISGQWDWWEAWLYAAITILGFISSRLLAARRHPDLLVERARSMSLQDARPWDRKLAPLVALGGALLPLAAGLEARFSDRAPFSLPVKVVALLAILSGYLLASYALYENRYFSGVVRIQRERGHQVVSSGPYRWIRHPGYAGGILTYLATPFFLDSRWALLPALVLTILLCVRTRLEDRTLQDELTGYRDYAHKVRFRLLPGIW